MLPEDRLWPPIEFEPLLREGPVWLPAEFEPLTPEDPLWLPVELELELDEESPPVTVAFPEVAPVDAPPTEPEGALDELLPVATDDDVLIVEPPAPAGHWQAPKPSPPLVQTWTPESPPTQAHETSCPGVQSGFEVEHPAPSNASAAAHLNDRVMAPLRSPRSWWPPTRWR